MKCQERNARLLPGGFKSFLYGGKWFLIDASVKSVCAICQPEEKGTRSMLEKKPKTFPNLSCFLSFKIDWEAWVWHLPYEHARICNKTHCTEHSGSRLSIKPFPEFSLFHHIYIKRGMQYSTACNQRKYSFDCGAGIRGNCQKPSLCGWV